MHHIGQALGQWISDSPRFFVRVDLSDKLEELIISLLNLECGSNKMSTFQGLDTDDVDGIGDKRLPNLKQVRPHDVFRYNCLERFNVFSKGSSDQWTILIKRKFLEYLPEFLLFLISHKRISNWNETCGDDTWRISGLDLGQLGD